VQAPRGEGDGDGDETSGRREPSGAGVESPES
jgi:hypothetical protein